MIQRYITQERQNYAVAKKQMEAQQDKLLEDKKKFAEEMAEERAKLEREKEKVKQSEEYVFRIFRNFLLFCSRLLSATKTPSKKHESSSSNPKRYPSTASTPHLTFLLAHAPSPYLAVQVVRSHPPSPLLKRKNLPQPIPRLPPHRLSTARNRWAHEACLLKNLPVVQFPGAHQSCLKWTIHWIARSLLPRKKRRNLRPTYCRLPWAQEHKWHSKNFCIPYVYFLLAREFFWHLFRTWIHLRLM